MQHKRIKRSDVVGNGVGSLSSSVSSSEFIRGGPTSSNIQVIQYDPSNCDSFTRYSRRDRFLKVLINNQEIEIF